MINNYAAIASPLTSGTVKQCMDSFASNWTTAIQQLLPDNNYRFFPTALVISGVVYLNFNMNSGMFYIHDSTTIALEGSASTPVDINKSYIWSFYLHSNSTTRMFNQHTINGSAVTSANCLSNSCKGITLRGSVYRLR